MPSLGPMILVVGSLLLLALLCWATYQSGRIMQEQPPDTNLLLSTPETVVRLVLIGVCLALGLVSGLGTSRFGWQGTDVLLGLVEGAAVGLVVQTILNVSTRRMIGIFGKDIYSPVVVRNILPKDRRQAVLVSLAFIPAVLMEELLFRSLLVGGLSVFFNPWLLAVIWSMLFGTMHLPQGGFGMIATSVVGFALSAAFIFTGSLLAPLAAHYVINLLQLHDAAQHRDWLESY